MFPLGRTARCRALAAIALIVLCCNQAAEAHEHHDEELPPGSYTSPEPIDSILWAHIIIQILTWGIIFPTGMVLGITHSRWHVWVQAFGAILAYVGQTLGHKHGGRKFGHNIHATVASPLGWLLVGQVVLGLFLRLHLERRLKAFARVRPVFVVLHGVTGKALPVLAWVQMIFGGIVALGFCHDDHLGQCLAHFIMGSAFIGYGIVLTLLLLVGQYWLRRTGRSQEFFDSALIAAWGCVNTFTEHRWGGPWVANDLQHTTMGIVWWCAGLLGMWLSRRRDGSPKRNLIPSIVIFLTGYGMSAHPQALMLSTMVHSAFGWTLMAAGATRAVEISFVLRDKAALSMDGMNPNSFQYLPPFLLYASGFLFMGATEEQMAMLSAANVTHVSYILILYSISFLLFLFVNILLHIYGMHAFPPGHNASLPTTRQPAVHGTATSTAQPHFRDGSTSLDMDSHSNSHTRSPITDDEIELSERKINSSNAHGNINGNGYGYARTNGSGGMVNGNGNGNGLAVAGLNERERNRVRDAQEFELEGLISGDDDEEEGERERENENLAKRNGNGNGMVRL